MKLKKIRRETRAKMPARVAAVASGEKWSRDFFRE